MINLETSNGHLTVGGLCVYPKMCIDDLLRQTNINIESNVRNQLNESYIIPSLENGKFAAGIHFYNNSIDFISISMGNKYNFPAFVITSIEKEMLNDVLRNLNGASEYKWGSVSMAEDLRGGMISIIIKYI
ncbi:hypothetical protein [Epilithonimonas caeni]|uniref:hypothetical protein n=1 Tax=Epilithonimonas caeni TaxID=365343 RepID=UPI000483F867|nr:hypothetical protein [Epilithonimonas caeni]